MSLKNRTNPGIAIDNDLHIGLKNLSKESRIPQSKLLDEAIELLLEKHGKSIIDKPIENPLDNPIELLDLPTKVYRILKNNWLSKVDTVRELTETDLSKIRGLGPSSIQIINERLESYLSK